jgi:hypothetical protein
MGGVNIIDPDTPQGPVGVAMMTRLISLSAAGLLACGACANEPPAAPKRAPVREYQSTSPLPGAVHNDPLPQAVRDALQADAAKQSGLTTDQLSIASSEKVTFTDGALGCPQPGKMYTQSLVPGYRVSIRAGKQFLVYHAAESGTFIQCATGVRRVQPQDPVAQ